MAWRQFVMHLGELDADAVETVFVEYGAVSVTLMDAADNPVLEPAPGETPLWSDTTATALFDDSVKLDDLPEHIQAVFGLADLPTSRIESLEDRDWEREWLKDFGPMKFGRRLWVVPTGSAIDQDGGDAVGIHLDPGLAFGTGTHATTALCLEWLDSQPLAGKTLLDYGCGSGVLAVAGLKLGCTRAVAMDIDPQALIATRQNAVNNNVAENLVICGSNTEIEGRFDVVVANILAGPLVQFAESITLTLRRHGMLTLSGVLCEQAEAVMAAYQRWIDFEEPTYREQDGQTWSRLTGKRRPGSPSA